MNRVLALIFLPLIFLAGCDDSSSQPAARERVVEASCKRLNECGKVKPKDGIYTSMENCRVLQASAWESNWPPLECDNRIDPDQLDLCVAAINQADCGAGLDLLNILVTKCPKEKICAGVPK